MNRRRLRARAFLYKYGYKMRSTPGMPEPQQLRERSALLTEEVFEYLRELLPGSAAGLQTIEEALQGMIRQGTLAGPEALPKLLREMGDVAITMDGSFEAFGVDQDRVLGEIQQANMKKVAGGWKPKKPEGWKPPDMKKAIELPVVHGGLWWVIENGTALDGFESFAEAKEVAELRAAESDFTAKLQVKALPCPCASCRGEKE